MKTIVIDAGHGGYDFGAVNGSRLEKNDNLRLAQAVRDKLAAQGQKVIMTRDSDVFVPLLDRSYIANNNNADIFVSLHRNSSTNPAANGVENFVYTTAPPSSTVKAKNVLDEVVNVGVQSNRGIKKDNFSVLRNTIAPAQLLELGFISNEIDNNYFDRYLDSYATAITKGILESLNIPYIPPSTNNRATVIKSIQSTLNQRYNTGLVVDGIYGANTRRALTKGLQTELNKQYGANLTVDGLFGPATRSAVRNVRRGASGNIAYILQAALFANGYDIAVDGEFGRLTEEAVSSFQRSRGLSADGIAGPATFAALLGST